MLLWKSASFRAMQARPFTQDVSIPVMPAELFGKIYRTFNTYEPTASFHLNQEVASGHTAWII
jgi:hypothetical protein